MSNKVGRRSNSKEVVKPTTFFDSATGETVDVKLAYQTRARYKFTGSWRAMGMDNLLRILRSEELTDTDRRIALWIPTASKKGEDANTVILTAKAVFKGLGINKFALSRAIPKLLAMDLIRRTEARGCFLVNPDYAFSGKGEEQVYARNVWEKVTLGG